MASASNGDVGDVSLQGNAIAFVEKGDLILAPGPAELDLREALRAWAARTGHEVKALTTPRWTADGWCVYAQCGAHDSCLARFKAVYQPGTMGSIWFRPHSESASHTNIPSLARKDAARPISRETLRKIKASAGEG